MPEKKVRFAEFELDFGRFQLYRGGNPVRLEGLPLQLLMFLIEHQRQLVTREQIAEALWGKDVFVDVEQGINTAIRKVRMALEDDSEQPQYLQTVVGRGYRFIAPVEEVAETGWESPPPVVVGESPAPRSAPAGSSAPDLPVARRSVTRGLFGLIQIMYLIFYLAALVHLRQIDDIAGAFLPSWAALAIMAGVMITAGPGIPLRCYLLSAVSFDYPGLGSKFGKLFLPLLVLDELWAVAPFLLVEKIGLGAAFAATAGLLYIPFSERTLVRMAYPAAADAPLPAIGTRS